MGYLGRATAAPHRGCCGRPRQPGQGAPLLPAVAHPLHSPKPQDLAQITPTGALIDAHGGVVIYFAQSGVEYKVSDDQVQLLNPLRASTFPLIPALSPQLKAVDHYSMTLSWYKLPLPVGIVQTIELQYSTEGDKWLALTSKSYHKNAFYEFTVDDLLPGREYRFRMRYLSVRGWADWSLPAAYRTLPVPPDPPAAPICTAITCYAAELTWCPPQDNGSVVLSYVLQGRSVGDEYVELYRGPHLSHLALGLFPEYPYSFQLAAVSAVGQSLFSLPVTLQTPSAPSRRFAEKRRINPASAAESYFSEAQIIAATRCRDAWQEFWDPRTEQVFYFNSIIATRQLEVPAVLKDAGVTKTTTPAVSPQKVVKQRGMEVADAPVDEAALEIDKSFRLKRYRLLRALQKRKSQLLKSFDGSYEASAPSLSSSLLSYGSANGQAPIRKDTINITLHRDSALEDCFKTISKLNSRDLLKTFKFNYAGESGIDSGGLGKEAFLVVSKEAAVFAGPKGKQYMRYTKPGVQQAKDDSKKPAGPGPGTGIGLYFLSPSEAKVVVTKDTKCAIPSDGFGGFLGKLLAKALLDRQLVDFPLCTLLLRHMLGVYQHVSVASAQGEEGRKLLPILLNDMRSIDGEYCNSMKWILENDITHVLVDETFVVEDGARSIPLCANGDQIAVTEDSKRDYVCLLLLWKLQYSVAMFLTPFLEAFHAIVPLTILDEIDVTPQELGLILCGKQTVNVEELRAYCIYQDDQFSEFHESAVWFWRAVREFDDGLRRRLLQFFTGSGRVPLDGYDPPLTLTLGVDMMEDSLPKAHTCFNQLVLPVFTKYDVCKAKLVFAVENCDSFELA